MGPAVVISGGDPPPEESQGKFRRLSKKPGQPDLPTALPIAPPPPVYGEWGPEQWEQAQWPLPKILRMLASWVVRLSFLRWIRRRPDLAAQQVRHLFEQLGGLWIEVGRLLSRRTDLFSAAYCQELAKIAQPRLAVPFEVTQMLFERDIKVPLESEFSRFDETPIAVLPFGQVYRARRRNGQEVMVKVQRPDVAAIFKRDIAILRTVTRALETLRIWPYLRWKELLWEIEHTLTQESDLRYEAANLRRMRKKLRRHNVYVPRVCRDLSSAHILTTEYIAAPTLRDVLRLAEGNSLLAGHWFKVNRISRKKLGRRLLNTFLRQVLEDNLFHTNLSPENVLVFQDSRFALVGFSDVSSLEKYFLSIHGLSLRALSDRDYVKVVDYLFLQCDVLPAVELSPLRVEIGRLLRAFEARAALHGAIYEEKSYLALSNEISHLMIRRRAVQSWQSVNIARAWMHLDDSLRYLLPNINFVKMLGAYFEAADKRRWKGLRREGLGNLAGSLVSSITEQWMFLSAQLRKKAQVFQGVGKAAYFASTLLRFAYRLGFLAMLAAGWVFLNQHFPHRLGWLHQTSLGQLARQVRHFPIEIWTPALIAAAYVTYLLRRTGRRMAQNEARLP
jgi:ubiquinone biosynthesis protein